MDIFSNMKLLAKIAYTSFPVLEFMKFLAFLESQFLRKCFLQKKSSILVVIFEFSHYPQYNIELYLWLGCIIRLGCICSGQANSFFCRPYAMVTALLFGSSKIFYDWKIAILSLLVSSFSCPCGFLWSFLFCLLASSHQIQPFCSSRN